MATSSSTELSVSSFQWKTLHPTVLLLKSTSDTQSRQKLLRFSRKKTVCASRLLLKSAVMVCSWSRSAPQEQLQFQLSSSCVPLALKTTNKSSKQLQETPIRSSLSSQTSTKSKTTKNTALKPRKKATNGSKRNSLPDNKKNTVKHESTNF